MLVKLFQKISKLNHKNDKYEGLEFSIKINIIITYYIFKNYELIVMSFSFVHVTLNLYYTQNRNSNETTEKKQQKIIIFGYPIQNF